MDNLLNPVNVEYSSLNKRVIAAAIDLFILLIVIAPIMNILSSLILDQNINAILHNLSAQNGGAPVSSDLIMDKLIEVKFFQKYITLQLISLALMSSYILGFWIYDGRTPGKWACGCKIVNAKTFANITYKQIFLRWLGYIVSGLTLGIGFIIVAFTKNNRSLHDKIAGTAVINCQHNFKFFEALRRKIFK